MFIQKIIKMPRFFFTSFTRADISPIEGSPGDRLSFLRSYSITADKKSHLIILPNQFDVLCSTVQWLWWNCAFV